ncbi:hybrid sensor histidine kinase/response regulator [Anabaena subtropica]|uniref:histidine kinase n=1 Tax=Anabaena subtropica FACHB-260 TaxID=2692884 RepID=A0ABR8CTV3_9NOST|nr:response regulator [Anabaena subtropica]MBD2346211.1 hybrid sensor histidine kinase/response regulator [Anabaena subtropica FACHB-260]
MILNNNYKGNVLVVDDTPDNLRLLSAMLTAQGFEVRKALNGKMGLTACQMVLPDVILLDISMPDMDGYQVCQQLKADDKTSDIPVIFISALDDVLDKVKAFDVGGADYITKPFHGAEVILRIENQINLRLLQLKLQEKNLLLQNALHNLKVSQVQQIQNEKMAALGQLVAGIAHEVNNPISFIYGNLQYASQYIEDLVNIIEAYQQEYPEPTSKLQQLFKDTDLNFVMQDLQNLMDAMYRGSDRIRELVLALQNFSRHDEAEMKLVNIHQGIDSTLMMLQHRLNATQNRPVINVVKEYGNLPLVTCYPRELNQVFMHILNNAIDSLEQSKVESQRSKVNNSQLLTMDYKLLTKPQIRIRTELLDSDTVRIAITDNGIGIKESWQSRLFDPFFTTKTVGKGSGLGLSISYHIVVQKHQGQITFSSSSGQGAEFVITIPIK